MSIRCTKQQYHLTQFDQLDDHPVATIEYHPMRWTNGCMANPSSYRHTDRQLRPIAHQYYILQQIIVLKIETNYTAFPSPSLRLSLFLSQIRKKGVIANVPLKRVE